MPLVLKITLTLRNDPVYQSFSLFFQPFSYNFTLHRFSWILHVLRRWSFVLSLVSVHWVFCLDILANQSEIYDVRKWMSPKFCMLGEENVVALVKSEFILLTSILVNFASQVARVAWQKCVQKLSASRSLCTSPPLFDSHYVQFIRANLSEICS